MGGGKGTADGGANFGEEARAGGTAGVGRGEIGSGEMGAGGTWEASGLCPGLGC